MLRVVAVLTFAAFVAHGCHRPASVGVYKNVYLEPDTTQRCVSLCTQAGLALDSVVIMAGEVGCVCRPAAAETAPAPAPEGSPAPEAEPAAPAPSAAAGAAGGMAAVLLLRAAAADDQNTTTRTVQPVTTQ